MAKRISITIPDEMYQKIQDLKEEMTGKGGNRKISKIYQKAIGEALVEAESSRTHRLEGKKDGELSAPSFDDSDKNYISRVLDSNGPYQKWSRYKKVEELKNHFEEIKKINIANLYPKFIDIMDGKIELHDWVRAEDDQIAEDRRSEMAWSYVEGFYEGVRDHHTRKR